MTKTYFALFIVGLLLTWLTTPTVIRVGHRFRIYGHSHGGRKTEGIPCLGGVGIFLAVLLAWGFLRFALPIAHGQITVHGASMTSLLLPATLALLLGIYDDVAGATPWQKLLIEFLAAGTAWWLGIRIVALPVLGYPIHSVILSFLLTVLWITTVTNALNLIDGLDGLAAGIKNAMSL